MKKYFSLSLVVSLLFVSSVSFAAKKTRSNTVVADSVSTSTAENHHMSESPSTLSLGASTDVVIGPSAVPALTALFDISDTDSLQVFLGVGATTPIFELAIGALLKHQIAGTRAMGLHVGGGVVFENQPNPIGTGSAAAYSFTLPFGVHMQVPGADRIILQADAGPVLTFFNSTTSFSLGALSSAFGLTVAYTL